MRQLRSVSLLLVLAGLALIPVALLLDLSPTWTLTGLLLVWAGIVKIVVVHLWRGIAASGGTAPVAVDDD